MCDTCVLFSFLFNKSCCAVYIMTRHQGIAVNINHQIGCYGPHPWGQGVFPPLCRGGYSRGICTKDGSCFASPVRHAWTGTHSA